MRLLKSLLLAASLLPSVAHAASEGLIIAPPPAWVTPEDVPVMPETIDEAPVRLLLTDQQVKLEPGKQTVYSDVALAIQTPQGLSAGNLSFPWNPETDEMTVHKLIIHRGDEAIDVLASGQTFTVVRREANLENATLDGILTANIQPEGLRVGDILQFAITVSSSDPVMQGHVEQFGGSWNGLPIGHAHFRAQWPADLKMHIRRSDALPPVEPKKSGTLMTLDLSLDDIEPIIPPRFAPARYQMGRLIEMSDYRSWAELGALMAPLYAQAGVVPAQGPLRNELEKIKAASDDPVARAEAALRLVQDRVRYVALLMGVGGYVPASAEESWGRRFGDCKAKSALLLALLHELGFEAEAVAVNALSGDGLDERLPMVGLFNHVIVRAHIAGKTYWMDGTRTGDTSLARLTVPNFGWGLPLVAKGAALVRMVPPPLDLPERDVVIEIDARGGLSLPAPIKATTTLRGDGALGTKLALGGMTASQRTEALRNYWKQQFRSITVETTAASYDEATGVEILTVEGTTEMDWDGGWYRADKSGLGYDPDFARPEGPNQDAPYLNDYPEYLRTQETILLPKGFSDKNLSDDINVDETIAGTAYRRVASLADGVFKIEVTTRAIAPEFSAAEAPAAEKALKALQDKRAAIREPQGMKLTVAELDAMAETMPDEAQSYTALGVGYMEQGQFDMAIENFTKALEMKPDDAFTLGNRANSYAWVNRIADAKRDLERLETLDPEGKYSLIAGAVLAERNGETEKAIAAYSKAIESAPNDSFAYEHRASLRYVEGDFEGGLADIEALLAMKGEMAQWLVSSAYMLFKLDRREEALDRLEAAVAKSPDDDMLHVRAGNAYAAFGARDKAIANFDRAIAIKPSADYFLGRAGVRARSDLVGREADIEAALAIDPDMDLAMQAKAELLVRKGAFADAVKAYTALLVLHPYDAELLNLRGLAYLRARDEERARADFETARMEADTAFKLNNLCYAKATAGIALERALDECEAALADQPDQPGVLDSKAFVLLRLGRLDAAIASYDLALAKEPNMAPALYGRAVAWSRKGDAEKARIDLAAARRLDLRVEEFFNAIGVTL